MRKELGFEDDTVGAERRDEAIRDIHAALLKLMRPLDSVHPKGPLVSNHNPALKWSGPKSPMDEVHVHNYVLPEAANDHPLTSDVEFAPDKWTWLNSITS